MGEDIEGRSEQYERKLGKGDGAKERVVRRNKEQRIKRKNEQQWGEEKGWVDNEH